jgi:hypothetical protein
VTSSGDLELEVDGIVVTLSVTVTKWRARDFKPRAFNRDEIKVAQVRAQSDHYDAARGLCCGDPGDCSHECGMGRH